MSSRLYRVVKRMSWMEGGTPAPERPELWEGGKAVVYEPGATVYIDDQEAALTYHDLEAMDDAGRANLEEARARAEAPPHVDLDQGTFDRLTDALDEKRRVYGCQIERIWATNRDGTKELLSTRYYPTNPEPGVVYGDNGLPDPLATALQRERREKESKQREMENQFARIRGGASRGGRRGRETRRDEAARSNEALLADVRAYRAKHPSHGCPAIAKSLIDKHGSIKDHADPRGREKAIEALRKKIGRLGGSLDR